MARFIRVTLGAYDSLGIPTVEDESWLNIYQIVRIDEHLGNNLFRRRRLGGGMPEQHYPCLLVTTADGRELLISLGTADNQTEAAAMLAAGLHEITSEGE